jgi:ubiquinone biosynthesis protein COQ4
MNQIARGWLMGQRAKPFFGAQWSKMWAEPLDEVRATFQVLEHAAVRRTGARLAAGG